MKTTSEGHTPTQRVLVELVKRVVDLSETTRRLASEDVEGDGLLAQLRAELDAAVEIVSVLEGDAEGEVPLEVPLEAEARTPVDRPAEIVESLDDLFGVD